MVFPEVDVRNPDEQAAELQAVTYAFAEEILDTSGHLEYLGAVKMLGEEHFGTLKHSVEVAKISVDILNQIEDAIDFTALGIDKEYFYNVLFAAALLHDLGKIKVGSGLLDKVGQLTAEDIEKIQSHPIWSFEAIMAVETDDPAAQHRLAVIALLHHTSQSEKSKIGPYPSTAERQTLYAKYGIDPSIEEDPMVIIATCVLSSTDVFSALTDETRRYLKENPNDPTLPEVLDVRALEDRIDLARSVVSENLGRIVESRDNPTDHLQVVGVGIDLEGIANGLTEKFDALGHAVLERCTQRYEAA